MSAIVKADGYTLSAEERARCIEHLQHGYAPQPIYATLWRNVPAPLTFQEFLRQFADAIVEATAPTVEHYRVTLAPELRRRQAELDQTARELRAALATLAEAPLEEGNERDAQTERQCAVVSHYGKGFQIVAALAGVTRELRALRASQLEDAASIVGMLASTAGMKRAH